MYFNPLWEFEWVFLLITFGNLKVEFKEINKNFMD